jgi:DNA-binding NarL/FixJ family response regulator
LRFQDAGLGTDTDGTMREGSAGALAVLDPPAQPAVQGDHDNAPDCLRRLQWRLGAARVALVRFDHASSSFEIVAATGRPFLAPGVKLSIDASALVLKASQGVHSHLCPEHSSHPLDRIAVGLGLRSGIGIPLTAAGAVLGAITIFWDVDPAPVDEPGALLNGSQAELLSILIAPERHERRVLVCHEDRLVAAGLARAAEQRLGAVAQIACTVDDAIAALTAGAPDLIVCSDHLSDEERLPQVARRLRGAGMAAPLLVVARTDSTPCFEAALQAGATGYLPLAMAADQLTETAAALLDGRSVLPTRHHDAPGPRLTEREQDVLHAFDRGLADKEIARELGVAISTVKTHARAIYGKLDATSRTAAIHRARQLGLI